MNAKEIKKYWDDRAKNDKTSQATTNDIYMKRIEQRELVASIRRYGFLGDLRVLDVGCGDGGTTRYVALECEGAYVEGIDFSEEMIKLAKVSNVPKIVNFFVGDIAAGKTISPYDIVYTTRCIINIPSWEEQKRALENIRASLVRHGIYIMIENFISGHHNMNSMRDRYGLPPIPIREHNHLLPDDEAIRFMCKNFMLESVANISSSYYLATRVLYAAVCKERGVEPDYFSPEHRLASNLPYFGDYGPISRLVWRAI